MIAMYPAAFDYKRPESAAEAISLVNEFGDDAKFLAGGHSLLPLMKLRLAQPTVLIDIGRLADLSYIRDAGDHIAIGALTRHKDVETSALRVVVPLTDKFFPVPDKVTVSVPVPSPNTALPVIVNAYAPLSAELVEIVDPVKIRSALIVMLPAAV